MEKKNIRGINELIDHLRKGDKIYQNVNGEYYHLDKTTILRMQLGTLLQKLDDCEIFIDNEALSV